MALICILVPFLRNLASYFGTLVIKVALKSLKGPMSSKTLFLGQALSSSLWKYVLHGVAPLFGVEVGLLDDLQSVGGEHPSEEEVDEEDLADDVDEVEDLAEDEAHEVDAVRLGAAQPAAVPDEVVGEGLDLERDSWLS